MSLNGLFCKSSTFIEPKDFRKTFSLNKAIKIYRFETNEDSWITLTDSCRTLNVPKIDVLSIIEFNDGEVIYSKSEEEAVASENAKDLVGLSSS